MRTWILVGLTLAGLMSPAQAVVKGRDGAASPVAAHVLMLTSTRGAACTATALEPDLLLTAAHCVEGEVQYAALILQDGREPAVIPARAIAKHPSFSMAGFKTRRPTPDIALVRLSQPLPRTFRPAQLSQSGGFLAKGSAVTVAGMGMSVPNDPKSAGKLKLADLVVVGSTGDSQTRLRDGAVPEGAGGAGACQLDSGAPVFAGTLVVGVVSWTTGVGGQACGLVTGITLTGKHAGWIAETAARLGAR